MTNTLHRYGSAESFYDDYVIFAIPSRGKNDKGSVPKLKQFLEMALPFKPVNLGDALNGGALRPRRDMSPTAHWKRDMTPDFRGGFRRPRSRGRLRENREGGRPRAVHQHLDLDRRRRAVLPRGLPAAPQR